MIKHGYNTPEELAVVNRAVFEYIKDHQDAHGYPPSRRDIARHIGGSANAAQGAVTRLVKEGLITIVPGVARGLRITESAMKSPEETT